MSYSPDTLESMFQKSDMTDAILVVERRELHVNKTLLSCHSDFFKTLFNSNFKEKSMKEIEIKDVEFEDFATLLSLVQQNPILPTDDQLDTLLELADRFLLPAAKFQLEHFVMHSQLSRDSKIKIADRYGLDRLLTHALREFRSRKDLLGLPNSFHKLTPETKLRIFDRLIKL